MKLLLAFKCEEFNYICNKIISERELKISTTKLLKIKPISSSSNRKTFG